MSLQDAVTLLAHTPLFQGVDPVRLEVLAFTATHLAYGAGETLVEEGAEADGAFLLLSGEAVMLSGGLSGQRRAARLDRGDLFGDIALSQPSVWTATVRAAQPVEVLKLSRDVFLRLADEFPEIAQGCFRGAVDRVEALGAELQALNLQMNVGRDRRRSASQARVNQRQQIMQKSDNEKNTGD